MCAEKPLSYQGALSELLADLPETKKELEAPLKTLWDSLQKNLKAELSGMLPEEKNLQTFLEITRDQLDYFLTAMSLSGTNTENCKDEGLAGLIEELEDSVEDLDDYLADEDASLEDGTDFKEFLIETWNEFVQSK